MVDQASHRLGDLADLTLWLGANRGSALEREPTDEYGDPPKDASL